MIIITCNNPAESPLVLDTDRVSLFYGREEGDFTSPKERTMVQCDIGHDGLDICTWLDSPTEKEISGFRTDRIKLHEGLHNNVLWLLMKVGSVFDSDMPFHPLLCSVLKEQPMILNRETMKANIFLCDSRTGKILVKREEMIPEKFWLKMRKDMKELMRTDEFSIGIHDQNVDKTLGKYTTSKLFKLLDSNRCRFESHS